MSSATTAMKGRTMMRRPRGSPAGITCGIYYLIRSFKHCP